MTSEIIHHYACVSVNHKRTPIEMIERVFFEDSAQSLRVLSEATGGSEVVLLQTCNRVEIYLYSEYQDSSILRAMNLLDERARCPDFAQYIEKYVGEQAAEHLFRVAASLDSMAVGEQEILGQVGEALFKALEVGTAGRYLKALFEKALVVGRRARNETEISRGPVSLAHAAVDMAEEMIDLVNKRVVIIGAGRTGRLLSSSLRAHGVRDAVILNRTYWRAARLAERYSLRAAPLRELRAHLREADVVFVATSASHHLIKPSDLILDREGGLLIFDLSNPRNVDPAVADLPFIHLRCLDDLKEVTEKNRLRRLREVKKVEWIIHEELSSLNAELRKLVAEEYLRDILIRADEIRRRELERAMRMLDYDGREPRVLEAMTRSIVSKILSPAIEAAKRAAVRGDLEMAFLISRILGGGERL